MSSSRLTLAFLIILCSAATAQDDKWKTLKTGAGGWMTGMHIHPSGSPVFARSDVASAYRWNETTQDWKNLVTNESMPSSDVYWRNYFGVLSLVSAPSDANVAYMAYLNTIYRSTNAGDTWSRTNFPDISMAPNSDESKLSGERLSVDPANANVVYFGSISNGLWVTSNGGTNWSQVSAVPNGTAGRGIRQILFDPTSAVAGGKTQRLFAMVDGSGVYESANGGGSWQLRSFGVSDPHFIDSEIADDGTLHVVGSGGGSTFGLRSYKSGSWSQKFSASNRVMGEVALDPFNANRAFLMSHGFDETWRTLNLQSGSPTWAKLMYSRVAPNIPWMAFTSGGWFSLGEVLFDPATPDRMWKAEGVGIWRTSDLSDGDVTWTEVSVGQEHLVSNDVIAQPGDVVLTGHWDRPIFRHENLDEYPVDHKPSSRFNSAWDFDMNPDDPDYVVAIIDDHRFCCYDNAHRNSGYSEDGGRTWTKFPSQVDFLGQESTYGYIAVSAGNRDNLIWLPSWNRLPYYTKNRGTTWTQVTLPGNSGDCCHWRHYIDREALAADRVTPGVFYLYDRGAGHVFKTTNGGESWVRYPNVLPAGAWHPRLRPVPGKAGHLWYSRGRQDELQFLEGLRRSTDGGQTWSLLPGTSEVFNLAVGKAAPESDYPTVYMQGKYNGDFGYWKTTNEGASWEKIGLYPRGYFGHAKIMSADPFVYDRLYVGMGSLGFAYYDGDGISQCPVEGTACNDDNPFTVDDVADGSCGCAGTPSLAEVPSGQCAIGEISIDGSREALWLESGLTTLEKASPAAVPPSDLSADWVSLHDDERLYISVVVTDDQIVSDSGESLHQDDAVEIYIDPDYSRGSTYDASDVQVVVRADGDLQAYRQAVPVSLAGVDHAATVVPGGYAVEVSIPWSSLGQAAGPFGFGLDISVGDDDDGGARDTRLAWNDGTDQAWTNPSVFGASGLYPCDAVNLVVDLQGPSDGSGGMSAGLTLPSGHPYQAAPWNYDGTEGVGYLAADYAAVSVANGAEVVDWVLVSVRSGEGPETELGKRAGLVLADGRVVFPRGGLVPDGYAGPVRLVVEHRNHLGVIGG